METAIVPGIYDPTLADEDIGVSTEEAFESDASPGQDGLFVGISSGANLAGALRVARETSDAVIVVVFCDGGEKYLSERFWDETDARRADGVTVQRGCGRRRFARTEPRRIRTSAAARLYGRDGVVTATFALPNTTEEGPRRRFLVRPQDYRDAEAARLRARRGAARVLPFASRSSRAAVAVRSRPRVAVFLVHHRCPSAPARQRT